MAPSRNMKACSINSVPHSLKCIYLGSVTIRTKDSSYYCFSYFSHYYWVKKSYKSYKTELVPHVAFQVWFLLQSTYSHCQLLWMSKDKMGDCECSFHLRWHACAITTTWNCNFYRHKYSNNYIVTSISTGINFNNRVPHGIL